METLIQNKLDNLPQSPGVYQFLNDKGKVIYVGKAKSLRSRVRSYFQSSVDSPKTAALVSRITDLEVIVTDNEIEALVLENNLIKKLKPRYNINLKDDKSFPYIRITNEPFPRIFTTRQIVKDGSKFFGPYTDVKNMKASLRMINQIFRIRSCSFFIDNEVIAKKKLKVCLDYHIKKCDGPCEGLVSQTDYNLMVDKAIKVIRGKTDDIIKELHEQMEKTSENLEFEKAAEYRDIIRKLGVYSSKQKVVSNDFEDRDIISTAMEGKDVAASILNIRGGKLIGKRELRLSTESPEDEKQVMAAVLKFYYNEFVEVPKEIIIDHLPNDEEALVEWLNTKAVKKVKFTVPVRQSEVKSLLNMCRQNAILLLKEIQLQRMKKDGNIPYVLAALKRDLYLKSVPRKIECFDISNLQGSDTVASMVVFVDGKPKKSLYRKFIIQSHDGPDDFASMREVIERRYKRLIEENEPMPDLIMVDGGKGQLSSADQTLKKLSLKNYEIIGLAKRLEEIFLPDNSEPQTIPKTSSSLKLLQHVRDEAHRFAITFHRLRRDKRTLTTELTEIKGIGSTIAEKLLKEFEGIDQIKSLSQNELAKVIGKAKAAHVFEYFQKTNLSRSES